MSTVMKIKIPNFKKWQHNTEHREWFALDADFLFDPKVQKALKICPDSVICYLALWPYVDYETETVVIRPEELKELFKRALNCSNNRFNFEKRFDALKNSNLVRVELGLISGATPDQPETHPNETGTAQNPHGSIYIEETTTTTKTTTDTESENFVKAGIDIFESLSRNDPNFQNVSWVPGFLRIERKKYALSRPELKDQDILKCWQEAIMVGLGKGKGVPYIHKTFENKVRDFSMYTPPSQPGKKPFWQKVKEATEVAITVGGDVVRVPGKDLLWNDPARMFQWNGIDLYPDQVEIVA